MSNLATKFGVKIIGHTPEIPTANGTVGRTPYNTGKNALISAELILINGKLFLPFLQSECTYKITPPATFICALSVAEFEHFCLLSKVRITAETLPKTFKGIKACILAGQQLDADLYLLQVTPKIPLASVDYTTVMLEP